MASRIFFQLMFGFKKCWLIFDSITDKDIQTERQTDRRTDNRQPICLHTVHEGFTAALGY